MAQQKMRIEYADGREVVVRITPKAIVMAESQFAGINDITKVRASMFMAWASAFNAGLEPADFDTWLNSVVDVDEFEEKEEGPTLLALSPEPLSD